MQDPRPINMKRRGWFWNVLFGILLIFMTIWRFINEGRACSTEEFEYNRGLFFMIFSIVNWSFVALGIIFWTCKDYFKMMEDSALKEALLEIDKIMESNPYPKQQA